MRATAYCRFHVLINLTLLLCEPLAESKDVHSCGKSVRATIRFAHLAAKSRHGLLGNF